jgi:hypothetical protein
MLLGASLAPAHAHKPSDSYLTLSVEGDRIDGQWDIALRDLDFALGLDANQDDAITWGEVKARHADIAAYALTRLRLGGANAPCPAQVTGHLIDEHSDGAYAVLRFSDLRRRAQGARRRLSLVLRSRPSASRPDTPEHGGKTRAGIFTADTPSNPSRSPSFRNGNSSSTTAKRASGTSGRASITSSFPAAAAAVPAAFKVLPNPAPSPRRWQPAEGFGASFIEAVRR